MRVHELNGAALDLWAARAAGATNAHVVHGVCRIADPGSVDGPLSGGGVPYRPSSNWSDAGSIIEREQISVWRYFDLDSWHAATQFDVSRDEGLKVTHYYAGPTPLIAAMRCFVAARFGSEVDEDPKR